MLKGRESWELEALHAGPLTPGSPYKCGSLGLIGSREVAGSEAFWT